VAFLAELGILVASNEEEVEGNAETHALGQDRYVQQCNKDLGAIAGVTEAFVEQEIVDVGAGTQVPQGFLDISIDLGVAADDPEKFEPKLAVESTMLDMRQTLMVLWVVLVLVRTVTQVARLYMQDLPQIPLERIETRDFLVALATEALSPWIILF
jgi:hypothetical protein